SRSSESSSSSSRRRRPSPSSSKATGRSRWSGRRWAQPIPWMRLPERFAATSRSPCPTTSCTDRTRPSPRSARSGSGSQTPSLSDFEQNRAFWDRHSDEYQETHREHIGRPEPRWGMWQLPESELQILGDVAGKDVLEVGGGAAQWSDLCD